MNIFYIMIGCLRSHRLVLCIMCSLPNFKKRLSFYCPPSDSLRAVLDAAKIADSLLLVMCPDDEIDDRSEFSLKCLMAQGVPNVVFAVQVGHH